MGVEYSLIPCKSCGSDISVDAESCPKCGAQNAWVHPTLERLIAHLNTLDRLTEYDVLGHQMVLLARHQNVRQRIGWFLVKAGMVVLIPGLFYSSFLGLALILSTVGMILIGFGLSFETQHELTIDLRSTGKTVGYYDRRFWADVTAILHSNNPSKK